MADIEISSSNPFAELQRSICGVLNDSADLSAVGVAFIPENSKDVEYEIKKNLQKQGLACVVMTPSGKYLGHDGEKICYQIDDLTLQVVEYPPVNRARKGGFATGLDVCNYATEALGGPNGVIDFGIICPVGVEQGEEDGLLVTTAKFKTTLRNENGFDPVYPKYALSADIGDGTVTLMQDGVLVGSFSMNQKESLSIDLSAGGAGGGVVWGRIVGDLSAQADLTAKFGAEREWAEGEFAKKSDVSAYALSADVTAISVELANAITEHGEAVWGKITGDLSAQTDLKGELDSVREAIPTKVSELENDAGYISAHQSLDEYAKKQWVEDKNYLTAHQDLTDYAKKSWVEDKNYLTAHQDLSEYAKSADVARDYQPKGNYLTAHQSLSGYATENWVKEQGFISAHQDLTDYAKKTWVQDQGYLTAHQDLTDYAKKEWVEDKNYLTAHQSLSGYATENWVKDQGYISAHQDLTDYAKKQWVQDQGYLTAHQSLDEYAQKSWVEGKNYLTAHQSLDGYATESWVEGKNYLTAHQDLTDYAKKTDIGNGTVTVKQGDSVRGSFTLNQSGDATIQLSEGLANVSWGEITGSLTAQTDLKNALDAKADADDLEDYALSADVAREIQRVEGEIPTKVSELENDAGYLSAHQSLADYARKAQVSISYSDSTKKITLNADGHTTEIDATDFIKDGMVESARYDSASRKIIISFNTDAGKAPISVDVGDLVHEYTAGTGLQLNGSEFSVDSTVATKTWVEGKNYLTAHQDLSEYAKSADVARDYQPKGNYLTAHQSLEGYATESWVQDQNYLTAHQSLTAYPTKAEVARDYQPKGEYLSSTALEGYATQQWVENKNYLTAHQDLGQYAQKTWVEGKGYATQQWVEDKNYLTSHQDLSQYAKKTWVQDQNYLTSHQDLTPYAQKTWVQNQGYLTAHQDLTPYAQKTWVEGKGYITSEALAPYALSADIGKGTVTIYQNGLNRGSFSMNQKGDTTINLTGGGSGGDAVWGGITGTLSAQTDLNEALGRKVVLKHWD